MKNDFIDLGCGLDMPTGPMGSGPDKKTYPRFSFTCSDPIDLPDGEFTFTAKGRKAMASEDTGDENDPRYRYEIEVHGFKPMAAAKDPADAGDALKNAIRAKVAEKMGDGEDA